MNQNVILGRVGGWVEVGANLESLTWPPSSWAVHLSVLKDVTFRLTLSLEEGKIPFVWVSCVPCRKVVGSISFPSEIAKEFLVRHSSVL